MEKQSYLASHIAIDLAIHDIRISVYDILNWLAPGLRKIFLTIIPGCKKELKLPYALLESGKIKLSIWLPGKIESYA